MSGQYSYEFLKRHLYSGAISDVLDTMGYRNQCIGKELSPLRDDDVILGPAFTSIATEVYSMPESPLTAQCQVVDQLQEGQVYVLVTRGNYNCAVFGELFATAVLQRKGVGVLLDGYVRDIKSLKEMELPLFYSGHDPRTSKGRTEINECQIPVIMHGVTIRPGDWIFADLDGVVVIPQEIAEQVFEKAIETMEKEDRVRSNLRNGCSLERVYSEIGAI